MVALVPLYGTSIMGRWPMRGNGYSFSLTALGPVKVNERIEDESDVNEGGEHQVEFLEA
jgi:hypothetical protein